MTLALWLSPHLDDAVLSCAGRIQRRVAEGWHVRILTIFSHADPEDKASWAARREEDRAAAALLGAEVEWLGWPDAPFRDASYRDFESLTGPFAPADADLVPRLHAALRRRMTALHPQQLYVPLGVGDHVDHRLVHDAATGLPGTRLDYEDRPYALVEHAVRRRLDALGLRAPEVPPAEPERYLAALANAPYVCSTLPAGPLRERMLARHAEWPPPRPARALTTEVEPLDPAAAATAEAATWAYRSQVSMLYGSRERYRALTAAHAERLGVSAPHAERYFQRAPLAGEYLPEATDRDRGRA